MFFRPIRSGMTRWIIWPSVSRVFERLRRGPCSRARAAFGEFQALAQFEGVVVGDDDLGAAEVRRACRAGTSSRLA